MSLGIMHVLQFCNTSVTNSRFTREAERKPHCRGDEMNSREIGRREAICPFGAAGAALALGCGGNSPTSPSTITTTTTGTGTTSAACAVTPSETVGPYPSLAELVRSDIREGRSGTTLTLIVAVVDSSNNCSPVANANVKIWQCDAAGN